MVSGEGCDWKIERSVVGRLGEVVHSIDSFIVCMFVCVCVCVGACARACVSVSVCT